MPIFSSLTESDIKIFENNSPDSARALKLLNKTLFTDNSTNEFSSIVKNMIQTGLMSDNLEYKKQIEHFGKKLFKCFETKLIHSKIAPDFLMLSKNISQSLDEPVEELPPLLDYSSGEESEIEMVPEASPDMTSFGAALLGGKKPRASPPRSRSPSASKSSPPRARPSSQLPGASSTRFRTPSPRASTSDSRARSRSPLKRSDSAPRGEKSKKSSSSKRSPSTGSSASAEEFSRGDNKRNCPWQQLTFTIQKKIEG